jgi:hypothetical protein
MAQNLARLEKKPRLTDLDVGSLLGYRRFGDAEEVKRAERRLARHRKETVLRKEATK